MQNKVHELVFAVEAVAAGSDKDVYYEFTLPGKWLIDRAKLTPNVNVAAHATDGVSFTLTNVTQSKTVGDYSTLSGADGALTAGTAVSLKEGTGLSLVVTQGDVMKLACLHLA